METGSEAAAKRPWPRRIVRFLLGFALALVLGKIFDVFHDKPFLQWLYDAQDDWIAAASNLSPFAVIGSFAAHTSAAWQGAPINPDDYYSSGGAGILSPLFGILGVVQTAFESGQVFVLLTLGLGALAVATFNKSRTNGRTIFLEDAGVLNYVVLPVAVIGAASVIAFALQMIMLGALIPLRGLTGIAAGATGVAYGCWYCVVKLGEKGVEHVLTSKIK